MIDQFEYQCANVGSSTIDCGWCTHPLSLQKIGGVPIYQRKISGTKTEQLLHNCVIWQYNMVLEEVLDPTAAGVRLLPSSMGSSVWSGMCAVQMIRYASTVEWSAFHNFDCAQDNVPLYVGRGVESTNETMQFSIKRAAIETIFGKSYVTYRVMDLVAECDKQHGDISMSLGGRFEPFRYSRYEQ
jgi:hypothetical protein